MAVTSTATTTPPTRPLARSSLELAIEDMLDTLRDLILEQTRVANLICDLVRHPISPSLVHFLACRFGLSFQNMRVMIGHLCVRGGGIKLTKSVKRVKILHEKSVVLPALDSQDDLAH